MKNMMKRYLHIFLTCQNFDGTCMQKTNRSVYRWFKYPSRMLIDTGLANQTQLSMF